MKKIVFLAAALMASMFILTSCEKENGIQNSEFAAHKWILIDSNYCDEYGNCGTLYQNAYNETETLFEVTLRSKKEKDCEDTRIWGTWHQIDNGDVSGSWCDHSDQSKKDCYTVLRYDDKCNLINSQIVHINK